jgi:glutaminase
VRYQTVLDELQQAVRTTAAPGKVTTSIPALAGADPAGFGFAVAGLHRTNEVRWVGDWQIPFSIQSVSKVFTLALVLAADGDTLWRQVGKEPSGSAFNSLAQLEREGGIPRNPFVNAGALIVTDRLQTLTGDASGTLRDFLRTETATPRSTSTPR